MGACCVACEVLYLALYLLSWPAWAAWGAVALPAAAAGLLSPLLDAAGLALLPGGALPAVALLAAFCVPFAALKQVVNVVQLRAAANQLAALDAAKGRPKAG